jgi:DNA-binding response OmpR family regulator
MRVLVTEDDEILASAVAAGLRREGMAVDVTLDGAAALERLAVNRYDVVVLDRDLPSVHGDDVCRALAAGGSETRVLMLTAARSVRERVEGLDLGADDYLPKPFDFGELVARIRALGRRAASPLPASLEHGDLSLDPARRVAVRAGRRLPLTTKELAVLECLLAADGRPVPAEELLERVWDEAADPFTTTVKTTIRRLRAKLGDPPVIQTVRESGYRIGEPLCILPGRIAVPRNGCGCPAAPPGYALPSCTAARCSWPAARPYSPLPTCSTACSGTHRTQCSFSTSEAK